MTARAERRPPGPAYASMLQEVCERLLGRAAPGLALLLIDGVSACGKSTLSHGLSATLSAAGRQVAVVENDWFLGPQIRSPRAILGGLRLALSGAPATSVEAELTRRFLDQRRLGAFVQSLREARARLGEGRSAAVELQVAWWNLALPRPAPALRWDLHPGDVLIIEGTLSRAVYAPHFPDHTSLFVELPHPVARRRFIERDRDPFTRRNLAFSMLARVGPAYRLAAELVGRHAEACDLRVDLHDLDAPLLKGQSGERRSA